MNLLKINSGVLNGARVVFASAVVAIGASAVVTASPYLIIKNALSSFSGQAESSAIGHHDHRAISNVFGTASINAYVINYTNGHCLIVGTANTTFIPANHIAYSNVLCNAEIYCEGLHQHSVKSLVNTTSTLSVGDLSVVSLVRGDVVGSCNIYAESGVNGVYDAYWSSKAIGLVSIDDRSVVTKVVGALLTGTSNFSVKHLHTQSIKGNIVVSSHLSGNGVVTIDANCFLSGNAETNAEATYEFRGSSEILGTGDCEVTSADHNQAGIADIEASAEISSYTNNVFWEQSDFTGSGFVTGEVTYQYRTTWLATSTANTSAAALQEHAGFIDAISTAEFIATGTILVRIQAEVNSISTAESTASALQAHTGYSDISASVLINADAVIPVPIQAESNTVCFSEFMCLASQNSLISGDVIAIAKVFPNAVIPVPIQAEGNIICVTSIIGSALQAHVGNSNMVAIANVLPNGVIPVPKQISGSILCSAFATGLLNQQHACNGAIDAVGLVSGLGFIPYNQKIYGHVLSISNVSAIGTTEYFAYGNIVGKVEIAATNYENFAGFDAQERTFVRPESTRFFVRPETVRVFKRV